MMLFVSWDLADCFNAPLAGRDCGANPETRQPVALHTAYWQHRGQLCASSSAYACAFASSCTKCRLALDDALDVPSHVLLKARVS